MPTIAIGPIFGIACELWLAQWRGTGNEFYVTSGQKTLGADIKERYQLHRKSNRRHRFLYRFVVEDHSVPSCQIIMSPCGVTRPQLVKHDWSNRVQTQFHTCWPLVSFSATISTGSEFINWTMVCDMSKHNFKYINIFAFLNNAAKTHLASIESVVICWGKSLSTDRWHGFTYTIAFAVVSSMSLWASLATARGIHFVKLLL